MCWTIGFMDWFRLQEFWKGNYICASGSSGCDLSKRAVENSWPFHGRFYSWPPRSRVIKLGHPRMVPEAGLGWFENLGKFSLNFLNQCKFQRVFCKKMNPIARRTMFLYSWLKNPFAKNIRQNGNLPPRVNIENIVSNTTDWLLHKGGKRSSCVQANKNVWESFLPRREILRKISCLKQKKPAICLVPSKHIHRYRMHVKSMDSYISLLLLWVNMYIP